MKNIHLIPTDKPSRLGRFIDTGKLSLRTDDDIPRGENINIYITVDEEIQEGDWIIDLVRNNISEASGISNEDNNIVLDSGSFANINQCKKIILTTDQDLIADGVQSIDDKFLEWFVKNPSCEKVKVEIETTSIQLPQQQLSENSYDLAFRWINKKVYKIIIPQEESKQETLTYTEAAKKEERIFNSTMVSKQETLEEAAYRLSAEKFEPNHIGFMLGVIEGAKWQQEQDKNKYSEEEVLNIIADCDGSVTQAKKWFEQFKKK